MALTFIGRNLFGGKHSNPAQERRPGIVCPDPALPWRCLWLRDRQQADGGCGDGRRNDLSPDAPHAGGWAGQHLSGGGLGRATPQILPADGWRTQNTGGPAGRMEKLPGGGGENVGGRRMTRALFIGKLRQGLKGLNPAEIDDIV